jgi:molybdopterin biosynthesis enzyme
MDDVTETTQRIARLTPLADVLARIDAQVKPVAPRVVALAEAAGRVLAGDVIAGPRPPVAVALRDGWALSSEQTTGASSYAPAQLAPATRIDAGEPMPTGADAVAPLDSVIMVGDRAEITAAVGAGEGVLPPGGDIGPQSLLARAGARLTRLRAGVLAAAGVRRVAIHEPLVRLVRARPGGDPVIDAGMDLVAGEITAAGGCVLRGDANAAPAGLEQALADQAASAIVAIGGTGAGRHDGSIFALARLGRVEAHGIALSPGETAALGFVGARPVLLLPGRIDATLAAWLAVGRHLQARLSAHTEAEPARKLKLGRKVASALGLAELVPVRVADGMAEPIASGYVPLSALLEADGWILVPPLSEGYPPGAEVVVRPWL